MVSDSETFHGALADVRAFCAVIDFHTISSAARHAGETKGSVSRRVARLERALGVRLLARTARAITPTSEGTDFYARSRNALALLDDATGEARKSRADLRGGVRVTAPIDFALELLPDAITSFRRRYPKISIEILASDDLIDLTAHRADLALRVGAGKMPDMGLQAPIVAHLEMGLFASPAYLQARPTPQAPPDLAEHDLVLSRERQGLAHMTFSNGRNEARVSLHSAGLRASDFACVLRLAVSGGGIAPLPVLLTRHWLRSGALVRVLPEWKRTGPTLHALSVPGAQLPARVRAFRNHLVDHLAAAQG